MLKYKFDRNLIPSGFAYITVEQHSPAGIFKEIFFSINSNCKGCWHNCGHGEPIKKKENLESRLKAHIKHLANCSQTEKKKPRIKIIYDFRKQQKTLF